MKNKASLTLLELLVMILVFSLAAAACLGIFAAASATTAHTARREEAALIAQNSAELLKSGIDPRTQTLPEGYTLLLRREASPIPELGLGTVEILWDSEPLFSLDTAWQEVSP